MADDTTQYRFVRDKSTRQYQTISVSYVDALLGIDQR
jgi:hypothetical protein